MWRSLTVSLVMVLGGSARAESLWEAEVRVGYGVATGSEKSDEAAKKTTPVTITAVGAMAISDDPKMSVFGGVTVETVQRNAFGFVGGLRFHVPGTPVHLDAGGVWIYAPETRWGALASVGACKERGKFGFCADLELTSYVAGSAMESGHQVTEIQAVLGMAFDLGGGKE